LTGRQKKKPVLKHADRATPLLFFAGCFIYTFLIIRPELIYHALGRLVPNVPFNTDFAFFSDSIQRLGGALDYLAGFLIHCFAVRLPGTLIITVLSFALFLAAGLILKRLRRFQIFQTGAFLPAILLLVTFARYANLTRDFLVLISALFAFVIFNMLSDLKPLVRSSIFTAFFIVLFICALPAAFVFAAFLGLSDILEKRSRLFGVIVLIASGAVYLVASRHFEVEIIFSTLQISSRLPSDETLRYPVYALYAFYFIIIAVAALFSAGPDNPPQSRRVASARRPALRLAFGTVLLLVVSVSLLWPAMEHKKKRLLLISNLCDRREWSKVLDAARKHPPSPGNFLEIHDINRALFYSGKLGDEMFGFPQNPASLLLNIEADDVWSEIYHRRVTIMFELGYPSLAEKFAYELLVYNKATPFVLDRLAHIYMLKQNPETAKIFLNALSKNLFYRRPARQMLEQIATGSFNDVVGSNSVSTVDRVGFEFQADDFFATLLRQNPKNKMAFEYMMAYYMLTKQLDKRFKTLTMRVFQLITGRH